VIGLIELSGLGWKPVARDIFKHTKVVVVVEITHIDEHDDADNDARRDHCSKRMEIIMGWFDGGLIGVRGLLRSSMSRLGWGVFSPFHFSCARYRRRLFLGILASANHRLNCSVSAEIPSVGRGRFQ